MQAFADFVDALLRGGILVALSVALGGVAWGRWVLRAPDVPPDWLPLVRRAVAITAWGAIALAVLQAASLGVRAAALLGDIGIASAGALLDTLPYRAGLVRLATALVLAAATLWLGA
ncbi:MAG TPA: hypothetical protein VNO26_12515, partial [Candidatus Limnocylindria bacterium]|nr:hypothetical protein [Candidatus Limnocylindria bacterium]